MFGCSQSAVRWFWQSESGRSAAASSFTSTLQAQRNFSIRPSQTIPTRIAITARFSEIYDESLSHTAAGLSAMKEPRQRSARAEVLALDSNRVAEWRQTLAGWN